MKKAIFLLTFVMGIFSLTNAQQKQALTVTIKTPTVQCESCKQRIENGMARVEGVAKTVVNYKNKTTKVTFWTDRTNIENVKTAIANLGYDADDVTAEPDAYKKLPLCCKKPEDGGGPAKH
ncbi:MAG: heavy-metal-associated domain-containing protein [Chitinophagaceae bacterium]